MKIKNQLLVVALLAAALILALPLKAQVTIGVLRKPKKVFLLMILLFLMGLGTAGVKAQVRIGGLTPPNAAAVLDLNKADTTNYGTKTLALPRVSLASVTDSLGNSTLLTGMLVYNTSSTVGSGVFYWDGTRWMAFSTASKTSETGVVGTVTGANGTYTTWCFPASEGLGCWMTQNSKEGTANATTYPGQAAGARGYYYDYANGTARTGQQYKACPPGWIVPSLGDVLALDTYLSLHPNDPFSLIWFDTNQMAGSYLPSLSWTGWGQLNHIWTSTVGTSGPNRWALYSFSTGSYGVDQMTISGYLMNVRCTMNP